VLHQNSKSVALRSRSIFYRRERGKRRRYANKIETLFSKFSRRNFAFIAGGLPQERYEGGNKNLVYLSGTLSGGD